MNTCSSEQMLKELIKMLWQCVSHAPTCAVSLERGSCDCYVERLRPQVNAAIGNLPDENRMTPEELAAKYCGPDGRLNEAGRAYVGQFAKRTPGREIAGWPQHVFKQWNGCSEPCDMWTGPCACGAYHREGR